MGGVLRASPRSILPSGRMQPLGRQKGAQLVLGIDPSTVRVSGALVGPFGLEDVRTRTYTKKPPRTGERLATILRETVGFAWDLEARPDCVFVEQPGGHHVEPELWKAVGVITAALSDVLDVPVRFVAVSTWKKLAVGAGHAKKTDVMRWAQANGYRGESQDEADAYGIAAGGWWLLQEEKAKAAQTKLAA